MDVTGDWRIKFLACYVNMAYPVTKFRGKYIHSVSKDELLRIKRRCLSGHIVDKWGGHIRLGCGYFFHRCLVARLSVQSISYTLLFIGVREIVSCRSAR